MAVDIEEKKNIRLSKQNESDNNLGKEEKKMPEISPKTEDEMFFVDTLRKKGFTESEIEYKRMMREYHINNKKSKEAAVEKAGDSKKSDKDNIEFLKKFKEKCEKCQIPLPLYLIGWEEAIIEKHEVQDNITSPQILKDIDRVNINRVILIDGRSIPAEIISKEKESKDKDSDRPFFRYAVNRLGTKVANSLFGWFNQRIFFLIHALAKCPDYTSTRSKSKLPGKLLNSATTSILNIENTTGCVDGRLEITSCAFDFLYNDEDFSGKVFEDLILMVKWREEERSRRLVPFFYTNDINLPKVLFKAHYWKRLQQLGIPDFNIKRVSRWNRNIQNINYRVELAAESKKNYDLMSDLESASDPRIKRNPGLKRNPGDYKNSRITDFLKDVYLYTDDLSEDPSFTKHLERMSIPNVSEETTDKYLALLHVMKFFQMDLAGDSALNFIKSEMDMGFLKKFKDNSLSKDERSFAMLHILFENHEIQWFRDFAKNPLLVSHTPTEVLESIVRIHNQIIDLLLGNSLSHDPFRDVTIHDFFNLYRDFRSCAESISPEYRKDIYFEKFRRGLMRESMRESFDKFFSLRRRSDPALDDDKFKEKCKEDGKSITIHPNKRHW